MQRCCLVTCVEDTDVTNCDPMSFKNEDHRAELSMFSLVVPGLLSLVGSHGINTNLGIIPMSAMILVSHAWQCCTLRTACTCGAPLQRCR